MNKSITKAKKIECWIGILFLIPPILGVLSFLWCLVLNPSYESFGCGFACLTNLDGAWGTNYNVDGGVSSSPAPIYLGLMAIAGAYLIKDSLFTFFEEEDEKQEKKRMESPTE